MATLERHRENDLELDFIFNFSLTVFSFALGMSAYMASFEAKLFLPSNIFFYLIADQTARPTIVYCILLLINVSMFASGWFYRNRLFKTKTRRNWFPRKLLMVDRPPSLCKFLWRTSLATIWALSPYWFTYYGTLKVWQWLQ